MLTRRSMIAGLASIVAIPALAATGFPDAPWVGQVQSALMAFHARFGRWPTDVPELTRFANAAGRPLDLSGFTNLVLRPKSPQSILVQYETKKPSRQLGEFSVSLYEVQPATRFWYYCTNPPGYYPSVQTCPTPWQRVPAR
jgi:hypothetical protein